MLASHLSDTILESYVMDKLTDGLAACEEYLLTCHDCQDGATAWDQFAKAMKAGAKVFIEKALIELLNQRHAEWKANPSDIRYVENYATALRTFNKFLEGKLPLSYPR